MERKYDPYLVRQYTIANPPYQTNTRFPQQMVGYKMSRFVVVFRIDQ